jgi:beta-galactosidase
VLECEFDLAYTPLMEMDYGAGRLTLCTLDLEDHVTADPAARRLALALLAYVAEAPLSPKARRAVYIGSDAGREMLESLGVVHEQVARLPDDADLAIFGPDAAPQGEEMRRWVAAGGKAFFLPRREGLEGLGVSLRAEPAFAGSLEPPSWPEADGLSASDLRLRVDAPALLLAGPRPLEVGADGLLARLATGEGVAVFCQIDPWSLPADEQTFFRYTRWRQTRAVCQVLANLGATFRQDAEIVRLIQQPEHPTFLAGTWEAQLTHRMPESPKRRGNPDPGLTDLARDLLRPENDSDGWQQVPVPSYMERYGGEWLHADGEAVFRRVLELPALYAGRDLVLHLGRVDEKDTTFFNGTEVGSTTSWIDPRTYAIPGNLVRAGRNVLAVRMFDGLIHGGVCGHAGNMVLRLDSPDPGFYHPDYRGDHEMGDDPYRYYRW